MRNYNFNDYLLITIIIYYLLLLFSLYASRTYILYIIIAMIKYEIEYFNNKIPF